MLNIQAMNKCENLGRLRKLIANNLTEMIVKNYEK